MTERLKAPYQWFGGKGKVAPAIWKRFGRVRNFVEPFFGSGAVLLARPAPFSGSETVNDLNGWLCNFWRALQADPDEVARHADWPVSELDLHARGDWLFYRKGVKEWVEQIRSDPDFYDAKSAGWWVWGLCCWIGTGWGPRDGSEDEDGGVARQLPSMIGVGVHRKIPNLGGDKGVNRGVHRQLMNLGDQGRGVHRQRVHLGGAGQGINRVSQSSHIREYLHTLAARVRRVRVCCGDWTRVLGPSVTCKHGVTAILFDPPYGVDDRADCYGAEEDFTISHKVREWCLANGDNPLLRIALCGYEGEHQMPATWECMKWKAKGGYGSQRKDGTNENARRERVWFSPHCLKGGMGLRERVRLSKGG